MGPSTPSEITEWIEDEGGTALCPYCGIESVIGENSGYPLTRDFLAEMHQYWFVSTPCSRTIGEGKPPSKRAPMNFEDLKNPELQEKLRSAKTADELVALAKEEGLELTEGQLEALSGGGERYEINHGEGCPSWGSPM